MAEVLVGIRLFWAAYVPLLFLLALRFESPGLRATTAALGVLGLASLWSLLYWIPSQVESDPVEIEAVRDHGSEVAAFLASYLLPFLTIAEPGGTDLAAYAAFLFVAATVYLQADMAEVNPTLYLCGYRVQRIRTTHGWDGFAITPQILEHGDQVNKVTVSGRVVIITKH